VREVAVAWKLKHNKRKASRAKLLVSDRKLQKHKPQLQKSDMDSIPNKDVFCGSETKHKLSKTEKQRKEQNSLFWRGYSETKVINLKLL
jgi:hypothetical protein